MANRPNAFVSIRIPSVAIQQKITEVQRKLLEKDRRLDVAFVPPVQSHLTLMVIKLRNDREIERAKVALQEAAKRVVSTLMLEEDPLVINFGGLGSFSTKVLFTKISEGPSRERLASMAEIVRAVFAEHNLETTDKRPFNAHLTVAKITADSKLRGVQAIPPQAYSDFIGMDFGSQEIKGLELLSMELPKTDDGYYHYFLECMFNQYYD